MVMRALCFTLFSIGFFTNSYSNTPAPPLGVVAEPAQLIEISDQLEALGTTKANEDVAITVSVAELVKKIHFHSGQRVKKGQILLELESREEQALYEEIKHTVDEAKSQLNRIRAVAKRGDASQSLLDEKQREYNVAQARLSAIQSRLDDRIIRAPFSGRVGLRNVSPGAYVAPGDIITTLIDDTKIKLDFSVPSIHINALQPKTKIKAQSKALNGKHFEGIIDSIDNKVDPISRSITVRAILDNPQYLLKPGLLMEIEIQAQSRKAVMVNEGAIVQLGYDSFVFEIKDNGTEKTALKTKVITGSRNDGKVEITQGIQAGAQIITHGNMKVQDGKPVRIMTSPTQSEAKE